MNYSLIEVFELLHVNETDGSNTCKIDHFNYFFWINFNFQPDLGDGFYDLLKKAMSFGEVAIVPAKEHTLEFPFGKSVKMKL